MKKLVFLLPVLSLILASCGPVGGYLIVTSDMALVYDCPSEDCNPVGVLGQNEIVETSGEVESSLAGICREWISINFLNREHWVCNADVAVYEDK